MRNKQQPYKRKRPFKKNENIKPTRPQPEFKPRVSKHLWPVLDQIGAPEPTPFEPDPFQIDSIRLLEKGDVIVSAPTGSGKTYIAVKAMERVLENGGRAWYASPLKALSNAKYLEFGKHFGQENVGLLTGDHKVNTNAPVIVGTTEILRNQLYDAMRRGENLSTDFIVMDEAHYLGDPERGVVWEEILIYLAPRVKLLLLSATIANSKELAEWLTHNRGQKCYAVTSEDRPVPLHPLFLFPDGELTSLNKGRRLNPQVTHYLQSNPVRRRMAGKQQAPFNRILRVLGETDLLPAIFFLKSRSDCDLALSRCYSAIEFSSSELIARREERISELLDQYPFLKTHSQLKYLRGPGVASHHAGQMPHWKLLVEQLMQDGLLTAIFSTSTVAAGVNFPARTVVIMQSDRFNGREFIDLRATELLQMTGRAGRRGMDKIGFAAVVPGPFQDPILVHSLFGAPPDPVISQIHINFSMVLNLLLSHEPDQIKNLLEASLAAFQQGRTRKARKLEELKQDLAGILAADCPSPEEAFDYFQRYKSLKNERGKLNAQRPRIVWEAAIQIGLTPGRLFEVINGQAYCAFEFWERRGKPGVMAAKVRDDIGMRKGQVRQKWLPLNQIYGLLETDLEFGPEHSPYEAMYLIRAAARLHHTLADPEKIIGGRKTRKLEIIDDRLRAIEMELSAIPCRECRNLSDCHGSNQSETAYLFNRIKKMESNDDMSGRYLWSSFTRHFEFLKEEGFVNEKDELTPDGLWASQLRLDHPLVIAAGVRAKAWPDDDPILLASLVAPFVIDREMDPDEKGIVIPPELAKAWLKLETAVSPMMNSLSSAGFTIPELRIRPALAIYSWAKFNQWEDAVRIYGKDPGDMAMLVFRTADNLRQLMNLADTHGHLAPAAREASALIMKEPVVVPL